MFSSWSDADTHLRHHLREFRFSGQISERLFSPPCAEKSSPSMWEGIATRTTTHAVVFASSPHVTVRFECSLTHSSLPPPQLSRLAVALVCVSRATRVDPRRGNRDDREGFLFAIHDA